jgi:hypothetical protein
MRIDRLLALERFQRARQVTREGLQAHERQDTLDETHCIDAYQIGQAFVVRRHIVQHANRQIAKARVLGEHDQERLGNAWTQAVADDDALHVACVEIAGGGVDAQRTDQACTLADCCGKCEIGAAPRDAEYRCVFEQVRRDKRGYFLRCGRSA